MLPTSHRLLRPITFPGDFLNSFSLSPLSTFLHIIPKSPSIQIPNLHFYPPTSIMGQLWLRSSFTLLILWCIGIYYFAAVCSSTAAVRGGPMILPLYFSSPNSSHESSTGENRLRRLLKSEEKRQIPNAHMRLYDDLLKNGYYTTRLWIGTPPQQFALIVDSGSTVTYVPCSNCEQCGKHQDPRFQPEASSTYQPLKCSADCSCNDERTQCTYERRYAEMSSTSGLLGEDIMSFGNESELKPQRGVFGCESIETGDLYSQHADGIMGLGRGQLSIVDQLVDKGVISDSFSLCYGGMGLGGGAMILGGVSAPPEMVFTRSDPFRSPYYNVELKEIHVAGKPLQISSGVFEGKHGTVLDSGTTYAYLPEEAFVAFKNAITKQIHPLKQIPGPDPNYHDNCFSGAGRDVSQLSKYFPEVNMVFSNQQKLSLSPENYLFRHTKVPGAYCLGIFQNGKDSTTLLGGIIVRNTLVTYDRENETIGFWKTNCSELWERLHVPGALAPPPPAAATTPSPAPTPLGSNSTETTAEIPPPTLAPSGTPIDVLPGKFRVGLITFDMLLSSNIRPNITELAEFIAHELEVNASQVQVLNFTFNGNDSQISLAIYPAASANYISNTTAMSIILRLTGHHMRLPENFGSYRLIEWKAEPQTKRTWWEQHFLAVVVLAAVAVVLALSASGLWFLWQRKQQELGTYRPVVAEQELQQLTSES